MLPAVVSQFWQGDSYYGIAYREKKALLFPEKAILIF